MTKPTEYYNTTSQAAGGKEPHAQNQPTSATPTHANMEEHAPTVTYTTPATAQGQDTRETHAKQTSTTAHPTHAKTEEHASTA